MGQITDLRAHGYDDKHAKTLINTLGNDDAA